MPGAAGVGRSSGAGRVSESRSSCSLRCMLLAEHFGLVTLIARGYRLLAAVFLLVYVLPLFTVGISRLVSGTAAREAIA